MPNQNRLFLDIHAVQTLPPSNINRDDTGSPKTAMYGGARRSRVSSQSWKRAIRIYFKNHGDEAKVGVRTLEIVRYLADKIQAIDPAKSDQEAMLLAESTINTAVAKKNKQRTKGLFFIGHRQAEELAAAALAGINDKKSLQAILKDNPSIDLALFGRMVVDDPSLNEDASAQVAHAISTHAVQSEFDFYTAVDDKRPEDNAGAGMLGTIEFNSSTLYRYANVAVHELLHQLGDKEATVNALRLFVEAFANSMPTGKATSFAQQTLPQAVIVSLRSDRPVNLVSAFERPVRSRDGYVFKSLQRLHDEYGKVESFVKAPLLTLYLAPFVEDKDYKEHKDPLAGIGEAKESLFALLDDLGDALLQMDLA